MYFFSSYLVLHPRPSPKITQISGEPCGMRWKSRGFYILGMLLQVYCLLVNSGSWPKPCDKTDGPKTEKQAQVACFGIGTNILLISDAHRMLPTSKDIIFLPKKGQSLLYILTAKDHFMGEKMLYPASWHK